MSEPVREAAERYEALHLAGVHDDRTGASTKYVEVCWRCAENFLRYAKAHPDEIPDGTYVTATRPAPSEPVREADVIRAELEDRGRLCARPGCGHRFVDHTEYDDVPCEGSHMAAPGSFVECECSGFVESETAPAAPGVFEDFASGPVREAELIRAEREFLAGHFDPEAGPHSPVIAAESGLRLCDLADALLADRDRLAGENAKLRPKAEGWVQHDTKAYREAMERQMDSAETYRDALGRIRNKMMAHPYGASPEACALADWVEAEVAAALSDSKEEE